jgi:3-deoxy-D-manno-octulosonic-acid transferase
MGLGLDMLYGVGVLALTPVWLPRMIRTGKIRTDWSARFGHIAVDTRRRLDELPADRPRILLHAVSVGEVSALRTLIPLLEADASIIVATTTDTGFARAISLFGDRHPVVRYPFDFSWMVRRFLGAIRPDAIGLVELELWPHFTAIAARRDIPVAVINGRLSARSFKGYRRFRFALGASFRRLACAAVQDADYAARFAEMGVADDRLTIAGTMKWDNAIITDHVCGTDDLAAALGVDRTRPIVVAGSTAPDETVLIDAAVPDDVQLIMAPRKPEHFDQAASDLRQPTRRTQGRPDAGERPNRFLLDTIGELRAAYAMADLAIVGRSFGDLYGSDMTEPIAVGAPTVIGPAVSDFQTMFDAFHASGGIRQVSRDELPGVVRDLLADEAARRDLVTNGRTVIEQHQGASQRHADILLRLARQHFTPREDVS